MSQVKKNCIICHTKTKLDEHNICDHCRTPEKTPAKQMTDYQASKKNTSKTVKVDMGNLLIMIAAGIYVTKDGQWEKIKQKAIGYD